MKRTNQTKLDRAAARRAAQAAKENAGAAIQEQQEAIAQAVLETRAVTTEEIEKEIAQQEGQDGQGGYTDDQRATLVRIAHIEAARATLRDYGLNYTIQSDRTGDRLPCLCGCGQFPAGKKSQFCPGHDAKAKAAAAGPRAPKFCQCGCEGETKGGNWLPGHDAKFHAAQKKAAREAAEAQQVA